MFLREKKERGHEGKWQDDRELVWCRVKGNEKYQGMMWPRTFGEQEVYYVLGYLLWDPCCGFSQEPNLL